MTPVPPINDAHSIGSLLQGARFERGLTLNEAAAQLRIPAHFLAAFENDDHWHLPDDAYTRLYLKAYADFLGFNSATLIKLYRKERLRRRDAAGRPKVRPAKEIPAWMMWVTPRLIQGVLVGVVALAITTYFGFEFKRMVAPPSITIYSPTDGFVTSDRTINVEGQTEREVTVRINGKPVSPDLHGNFHDTLELQDGLNLITIKSAKKHSQEVTLTRRVVVMPKDHAAAMLLPDQAGPRLPEN